VANLHFLFCPDFNLYKMDFLEKDLEQIIYESDKELLDERGLNVNGKFYRQMKIGNYGIADLILVKRYCEPTYMETFIPYLEITVFELKKESIGISAFLQALGYLKGIMRYMEKRKLFKTIDIRYKICLIGKSIDTTSTFIYLTDYLSYLNCEIEGLSCYTYEYEIDGIHFKYHSDYSLTNEGF
jgi:hypothetical protein